MDYDVLYMRSNMKKRILYAVATLFLLLIEVIIASYVHDDFIRSYVGDMLKGISVKINRNSF